MMNWEQSQREWRLANHQRLTNQAKWPLLEWIRRKRLAWRIVAADMRCEAKTTLWLLREIILDRIEVWMLGDESDLDEKARMYGGKDG